MIIVSGLGRCGTSLVMQMYSVAGIDVAGKWPYYEESKSLKHEVVKLLGGNVTRADLQKAEVIWMCRKWEEQARSYRKLLNAAGLECMPLTDAMKYLHGLTTEAGKCLTNGCHIINFADLLRYPLATATGLASLTHRELNVNLMAACVRPRTPECAPDLEITGNKLGSIVRQIRKGVCDFGSAQSQRMG